MRKIATFTLATLDGYIDNPHTWPHHGPDDEFQDYVLTSTIHRRCPALGPRHLRGHGPGLAHARRRPLRRPRQRDHQVRRRLPAGRHRGLVAHRRRRRREPDRRGHAARIKGDGEPLFRADSAGEVQLVDTRVFDNGSVLHAYRPL